MNAALPKKPSLETSFDDDGLATIMVTGHRGASKAYDLMILALEEGAQEVEVTIKKKTTTGVKSRLAVEIP